MDLIERVFGISPDGGNGGLEALILIAIFVVLLLVISRTIYRIGRGRS